MMKQNKPKGEKWDTKGFRKQEDKLLKYARLIAELLTKIEEIEPYDEWMTFSVVFKKSDKNTIYLSHLDLRDGEYELVRGRHWGGNLKLKIKDGIVSLRQMTGV